MLPYPGQHESHSSWSRRCDEHDRDQARWRREQASRSSNWGGYNYRPVETSGIYTVGGVSIKFEWCYPSKSKLSSAFKAALGCPGSALLKVQHGNPNVITSREDYLVVKVSEIPKQLPANVSICEFKAIGSLSVKFKGIYAWRNKYPNFSKQIDEVYSNDNH